MTKAEYLAKRQALLGDAKTALDAKDAEKVNAITTQVEQLDADFESMATATANLNALSAKPSAMTVPQIANLEGAQIVDSLVPNAITTSTPATDEDADYRHAWAKFAMDKTLTPAEASLIDDVNQRVNADFSHSVKSTPTLIPNTVVAGIWKLAEEQYPIFADARKFAVRGTLTFNKHDGIVAGDAQWVDEDTVADDEQNDFGQLVLKGFELSKVANVKWKFKAMGEADFISFLTQELADRIGVALGVSASHGDGVKQAKGIITELLAEETTPQVVIYDTQITYKDTTGLIAKIHSTLTKGSAFYANNATIWNQLANIVDANGRPMFVPDPSGAGIGKLFGYEVKADAGLKDGEVMFGNVSAGYVVNTNEDMSVAMEDHVKARSTDYGAYAIVDGGLLTTKAFGLLSPKA